MELRGLGLDVRKLVLGLVNPKPEKRWDVRQALRSKWFEALREGIEEGLRMNKRESEESLCCDN